MLVLFPYLATSSMSCGELSSARFINSLSSPCSCKIERKHPLKNSGRLLLFLLRGININKLQCNEHESIKSERKYRTVFRLVSSLV